MSAQLKPQVTVQAEHYSAALFDEFKPLVEHHWREIANYQARIPLDPSRQVYEKAALAGNLLILTARWGDELVGYAVFFLMHHPHYASSLFAQNDVIYVAPVHRRGSVRVRLIRLSEKYLRALSVKRISWHAKLTNDFQTLLERLDYQVEEVILGKLL